MTPATARDLAALPSLLGASELAGAPRGVWGRVQYDSRRVERGDLFVAVSGTHVDGHAYLRQARERGAVAAVVERVTTDAPLPQIRVPNSRRALATLAAEETGHPSREMVMVGVTGTNGKTTTTHLIRAGLAARGERTGVIGTVGYSFDGEEDPAPHTTPEAPELQRLLRRWRDRGATAVTMEVSSHALSLDRTYGIAFDAGVFTNLTQDHLDFHGTMESYREAKARLFRADDRGDRTKAFTGVTNMDDEAGRWIREHGDPPFLGYGVRSAAEVTAEDVRLDSAGTRLRVRTAHGLFPVALRLRGAFNVENALAAFTGLVAAGTEPQVAADSLGTVAAVPGRLEPVEAGQPFQVLVDYAHTPDALARALDAVRATKPKRLLCVFGCGGDRDRGKRPLMGAAAVRGADLVFITSDNPRSEDPMAIVAEIESGARGGAPARVIVDRQEAIEAAVKEASKGDALLIAGKGHETYQILADRTIPFDDRAVARGALRALGYSS